MHGSKTFQIFVKTLGNADIGEKQVAFSTAEFEILIERATIHIS